MEGQNSQVQKNKIKALRAEMIGVNKEIADPNPKFIGEYNFDFLLLSDHTIKTIKAYDAYGNKGIFDFSTSKKTYILDKDRKLIKIYEKAKYDVCETDRLEFLKSVTI